MGTGPNGHRFVLHSYHARSPAQRKEESQVLDFQDARGQGEAERGGRIERDGAQPRRGSAVEAPRKDRRAARIAIVGAARPPIASSTDGLTSCAWGEASCGARIDRSSSSPPRSARDAVRRAARAARPSASPAIAAHAAGGVAGARSSSPPALVLRWRCPPRDRRGCRAASAASRSTGSRRSRLRARPTVAGGDRPRRRSARIPPAWIRRRPPSPTGAIPCGGRLLAPPTARTARRSRGRRRG